MKRSVIAIMAAWLLCSCEREIPMVNLGIDDVYFIARMQKLELRPAFTGERYEWYVDGVCVSREKDYIFLAGDEGDYRLELKIIDPDTPYDFAFDIHVLHEEIEYSPYISKVYEYCPAPGQFINEMPKYEPGDSYADMLKKCEESISGTNDIMISLGGYGGYVTFGFDHTVINIPGKKDFQIWGNDFYERTNPVERGGSAEAGSVMVRYDTNCNGLPDDEWYELAGSEYYSQKTRHNYKITYHRPDPEHVAEEDETGFLNDIYYIPWTDSDGQKGYIAKNTFHAQDYYPMWVSDDRISFAGTLLPPNGIDLSGTGRYYVLYAYDWGYVDNHPNDYADLNSFDISWAVDKDGFPVNLPGVDFIRVYTGLNQYCGWLGETSTELSKARDLHIDLPGIPLPDPLNL